MYLYILCVYAYRQIQIYIHIHIYIYLTYVYIYLYIYICICIHVRIYKYIYIYIETSLESFLRNLSILNKPPSSSGGGLFELCTDVEIEYVLALFVMARWLCSDAKSPSRESALSSAMASTS